MTKEGRGPQFQPDYEEEKNDTELSEMQQILGVLGKSSLKGQLNGETSGQVAENRTEP